MVAAIGPRDLDKLLAFMQSLKEAQAEIAVPARAAESSQAKDWLTPEEDAACQIATRRKRTNIRSGSTMATLPSPIEPAMSPNAKAAETVDRLIAIPRQG